MEPVKKVCRIFYKGITIFYHMGDLDYRFLPFKRAYADYGILSRVRYFSAEKLQVTTIFQRGFTLPELPSPTTNLKKATHLARGAFLILRCEGDHGTSRERCKASWNRNIWFDSAKRCSYLAIFFSAGSDAHARPVQIDFEFKR